MKKSQQTIHRVIYTLTVEEIRRAILAYAEDKVGLVFNASTEVEVNEENRSIEIRTEYVKDEGNE